LRGLIFKTDIHFSRFREMDWFYNFIWIT
jgi:hypothetical protein